MSTISEIACELNESVENRYELVLDIAELAKKLLDESRDKNLNDPFSEGKSVSSADKVIYQALIMVSSERDFGDGLIG
ncbi:MAG: hypothetical protein AAGI66_01315 [Cyanobacteria bacterium P01_H01_bin.74]